MYYKLLSMHLIREGEENYHKLSLQMFVMTEIQSSYLADIYVEILHLQVRNKIFELLI
jgi:hypothetical protein